MIYGYARVSSPGQQRYGTSLEAQEQELRANGAAIVFKDTYTGTKESRPELDKLMKAIQVGDTVVVTKLDRIARSAKHGLNIIDGLVERGVNIHVLNMGRFDCTPTGKMLRTVLLAFAEFERDMIVQRTTEGKRIARQRPDYKEGRKPVLYDACLYDALLDDVEAGRITVTDAAEKLGISRAKWYRIKEAS